MSEIKIKQLPAIVIRFAQEIAKKNGRDEPNDQDWRDAWECYKDQIVEEEFRKRGIVGANLASPYSRHLTPPSRPTFDFSLGWFLADLQNKIKHLEKRSELTSDERQQLEFYREMTSDPAKFAMFIHTGLKNQAESLRESYKIMKKLGFYEEEEKSFNKDLEDLRTLTGTIVMIHDAFICLEDIFFRLGKWTKKGGS